MRSLLAAMCRALDAEAEQALLAESELDPPVDPEYRASEFRLTKEAEAGAQVWRDRATRAAQAYLRSHVEHQEPLISTAQEGTGVDPEDVVA